MFTVNGVQESSGLFFNYRWVDDVLSRTQGGEEWEERGLRQWGTKGLRVKRGDGRRSSRMKVEEK